MALQELDLLVPDVLGVHAGRRLHERERQHLHDVVLDDVAQRAGRLVEAAAVLDAEALGHRDLDLLDVPAVPDRLEDRIGEPQGEEVLDGLLAHVVVDPEDLVLVERGVDRLVEAERAVEVTAVRLLDDEPGELAALAGRVAALLGQRLGDHGEDATGSSPGSTSGSRPSRTPGRPRPAAPSAGRTSRSPRTRRTRSGTARPASSTGRRRSGRPSARPGGTPRPSTASGRRR